MKKLVVIIFAFASPLLYGQFGGGFCFGAGCNNGGGGGSGSGGSSGGYASPSASYAGTFYLPPAGGVLANSTESLVQATAPIAGAIANFTATVGTVPGGSASLAFTWRKNGVSQPVTCIINNGSSPANSCSDLTHSFTVAAGDLVDIQVVGSGSPAATTLVLQWGTPGLPGASGAAGNAGAGYAATSSTSLPIQTGALSLTTQTGLAYSVGARIRISSVSTPANYMEGVVTSYTGAALGATMDLAVNSGTYSSWNLNVTGNPGAIGAPSGTGIVNSAGGAFGTPYGIDSTLAIGSNTLGANTGVMLSRATAVQQPDTTIALTSASTTAFVGAPLGNAAPVLAEGMRVLVASNANCAGTGLTLDIGNGQGAKSVYQLDGVSAPNPSQCANGQQFLAAYAGALNLGAGGYRILSAGNTTPLATPGTSITLTGPRGYAVCTGTCTVSVPVPAAGYEFCVFNDDNIATAITLSALGSSAMYENSARTAYGTPGTGTLIVSAAAGNKVCIVGRDSTHYITTVCGGSCAVN